MQAGVSASLPISTTTGRTRSSRNAFHDLCGSKCHTKNPLPLQALFQLLRVLSMPLQLLEVLSMVRLEPFVQAFIFVDLSQLFFQQRL